jgi:hypothetical protein
MVVKILKGGRAYRAITQPRGLATLHGMNREDLRARMRRIEKLVAGLGFEASLWGKCSAPVLAVDRLEYIAAIHRAITALEDARIMLVQMMREGEGGPADIS